MSKYQELQKANEASEQLFNRYKEDCRDFVSEMRQKLSKYLGCDEKEISLLPFSKEELAEFEQKEGFLGYSVGDRLILFEDTFYTFGFVIYLGPENIIPRSRVNLRFKLKKVSEHFIVQYGKQDFKIHEGNEIEWETFLVSIFQNVKKFLENRFDDFIKGHKYTFGFLAYSTEDPKS